MAIFIPQQFAKSCWLACISYILWKSEQDIVRKSPDILSIEKLNFVWLYCPEIIDLLKKYGLSYRWSEYTIELASYLEQKGTIVYIDQIDHYVVKLSEWWWDSYRNLKWVPNFGYWRELPYIPSYIIYQPQYH